MYDLQSCCDDHCKNVKSKAVVVVVPAERSGWTLHTGSLRDEIASTKKSNNCTTTTTTTTINNNNKK